MGMGAALERFWRDDTGATAIEYGMIAAGIAVVISGAVYYLGDVVLTQLWQRIAGAFTAPS